MWLSDRSLNGERDLGKNLIAKYKEGNVIILPCKVKDLVDKIFSHNDIIGIWIKDDKDPHYTDLYWKGEAWKLPEVFGNLEFIAISGYVVDDITDSDTINIEARRPEDVTLPKLSSK